jgi:hypothetical protein
MSKLKLWKSFSLFMVLLLMSSLVAVVPARPVQANVSSVTVTPYDTRIIGANTGYRITMTAGASLNYGDNIIIVFPSDTGVPSYIDYYNVFVQDNEADNVDVSGQQITVTVPSMAIIPGQQFTVTFNKDCGITNPATSGSRAVTVWTTVEPINVTSSSYQITAVKVYTGTTAHSENATITGAIAAAIAGDIIKVPDGTYNAASGESFPLVLDKSVTIKSLSGASATRIEPTSDNLSAFNVTAANVTIGGSNSGFTIMPGGRGGIYADETGGSGITVQGCIFKSTSDGASRGMWFENLSNNALITGNSFATPRLGTGIQVINANGATISNNTVATGTLKYCFLTFKAEAFYPDRYLPTPYAEYVAENPSTIDDVLVTGNSITGIGLTGESRQAIRFAASTKPSDHGEPQAQNLTVGAVGVTISGNTFTNNNGQAVKVDADKPAPDDAGQIAHIYGAGNIHINNNNFNGNTIVGVDNGTTTAVDAKQNYWRHASGPSHDSLNYGDNVTAYVTFQPWLINTSTGTPPAGEIAISTASPLPDGTTGVDYSKTFSVTGGTGSYIWSKYSGTMPPGLGFVGSNLSGKPTQVNTSGFNFYVQVNDGTQATSGNFTMKVYGGAHVITTTSPLPNGTLNVPYGPVPLQATGGTGTYAWSLNVDSGPLPTGLGLASDGKISGMPTAAGTFIFNVKVTSDGYAPGTKDLSITISAAPSGGQKLIGTDSDAAPAMWGSNHFILSKFIASDNGTISQIKIRCGATVHVKVAIYSDSSGVPGSLLHATDNSTACIPGWNTISITGTPVISGTTYWLAFNSDASVVQAGNPGAGYTTYYRPVTYSSFSFPSSAGTGFTTQSNWDALIAGWSVSAPSTPTVTNSPATSISQISARLNGQVTDIGSENPTVIIYWGDNNGAADPYAWDHSVNLGTKGAVPFYTDITGLTSGTLYYYRCFAANSSGNAWATSSDNFTTLALGTPTVTNSGGASSVTATSARLNGAITNTGGENPTVIICWGDNDGRTTLSNWDSSVNLGTKGAVPFLTDITDLTRGTRYCYRCFASNSVGDVWATSSENFTTLAGGVEQKLIGTDSDAAPAMWGSNHFILSKFTADTTGTISQIKIRCGATVHVKVAIYSDSSGVPGSLLNATDTSTACIPGWNTISITGTAVTSGTPYWLAFNSDASVVQAGNPGAGYTTYYRPATYSSFSSFPSSAGTGFTTQSNWDALIAGWATITLPAPPATPTIVAPKKTITFEWTSSGATKYRLQVNTTSDFNGTSMFDAEVSTTSQAVTLTVGIPYYWRVKAGNAGGWSGWSSTGSVTP